MGVLTALNWQKYYDANNPQIITLPPMALSDINGHLKKSLGITKLKVIGDPSIKCSRIAILPGAAGGKRQIELVEKEKPDLLIVGEIQEWETAEYIRDGWFKRRGTALTILGHAVSEEAGMKWLVPWLSPKLPGMKISHIPSKDPFTWI
jgi:putative NIF3 family GTP cyclohydrolase 1 type 2